jgi:hypothetical protein
MEPGSPTFDWVDVGEGSTIFSFDPDSCEIVDYADPEELYWEATRSIDYNSLDSTIWVGDWHYHIAHFTDLPVCDLIDQWLIMLPIAGLAIDQENQHLWVITNESFDKFYEFDISSSVPEMIQGPIDVPWQSDNDGFDGAGSDYDQARHMLVALNQYWAGEGNYVELFLDVDPAGAGGVSPAGYCRMSRPTLFGWGVAMVDGAVQDSSYHPLGYSY